MEEMILTYIKAASNLYGFTTLEMITNLIYHYEETDIETDFIKQIVVNQKKRNIYKDYDLIVNQYISFSIKDLKDNINLIKDFQQNHLTKPVYFPEGYLFIKYADQNYLTKEIAFKQVYNYVIKHKLSYFDNNKTKDKLLGLVTAIASSPSFDEIIKYLDRISIKVREHTHRDFFQLLNYLYNNTRMYAYNGYTITEYQSLKMI